MPHKWLTSLTPTRAWSMFVPNSVELFISFFHAEQTPVTDINEMCQIYAGDMLNETSKPYTLKQQEHLAGLFRQYIDDHLEKIGGYEKLQLFTKEEVEDIEEKLTKEVMSLLRSFKVE